MALEKFTLQHLVLGMALSAVGGARAQDAAPKAAPEAPNAPASGAAAPKAPEPGTDAKNLRAATTLDIDLDIPRLLSGPRDNVLKDPVWIPAPKPLDSKTGKKEQLLVVPMRLLGAGFKAGSPPITPESGHFVAWYIPAPEKAPKAGAPATPPGASRFAAGFWVDNDRQIHWGVDRFNATMKMDGGSTLGNDQALYLFQMDHQRLAKQKPLPLKAEPPYQRPQRNKDEPAAIYRERETKAHQDYLSRVAALKKTHGDKVAQYAKVQDQVAALPSQFSEPRPAVVYAVYYVSIKEKTGQYVVRKNPDYAFAGFPQGKWAIPGDTWVALQSLAAGSGAAPGAGAVRTAAVEKLKLLQAQVASKHPAALQAASVALVNSGLLNDLAPDAVPFALADQIIAGGDATARQALVKGLVAANISTGKAELLKHAVLASTQAGENVGGSDLSVASLRVLLRANETSTDAKRAAAVVGALKDIHGPSPKAALAELIELMEGKSPAGGPLTLERAQAIAKGFSVSGIEDEARRKATIEAVLAASDQSPLAAVLVDDSLLSATGAPLLEALNVMAALPCATQPQDAREPATGVPLFSGKHHLLGLLANEDAAVRLAAWKALPAVMVRSIPLAEEGAKAKEEGAAALPSIVDRVVVAGLADKDTPLELPDFLETHIARSQTAPQAMAGLVRVLADGDAAASGKALDILSRPKLAEAFVSTGLLMDREIRWKIVTRSYAAKHLPPPEVAGLLLDPGLSDALFRWFGGQVAKGPLPMAMRFSEQVPPEAKLLDLVLAQDTRLAKGAVSALAYREGADDAQAAATVVQMLSKPYKLRAQMEREWESCKSSLFLNRIHALEGDRLVRLAAIKRGEKAWHDMDVGPVSLQWKKDEGLSLGVPRMALAPDAEQKTLTLPEAALLDRINPKARRTLELTTLSGAVPFTWHPPCWEAQITVSDDQIALIQIAPVGWKKLPDVPVFGAKKTK